MKTSTNKKPSFLKMKYELLKVLLLCFTCAFADNFEPCHTPTGREGACISIRKCSPLFAFVVQNTKSPSEIKFLQESHCGFTKDEIPKVCCEGQYIPASLIEIPDDVIFPSSSILMLPNTSTCGADFSLRILGGETADLDEFPWLALIKSRDRLHKYPCGGVLISARYVLTAAHCLSEGQANRIVAVRLGEYNKDSDEDCIFTGFTKLCLQSPPINVGVERIIVHERYEPRDLDAKNDIALIRLKKEVTYTDYIKPICLPVTENERYESYDGQNLTVAGWGRTENGSLSSIKLKVQVPVRNNIKCKNLFDYAFRTITEKQICAGGQLKKDSCGGDSGYPLMTSSVDERGDSRWYVAGIVSYGTEKCGLEDWPAVYTKVSKYIGWILRHMER
ncbi:hypothetical protein HHI36_000520 [Cryptolaemus montrouzieri]|uniref:CLIP domain-containing serine protease n=1 Tax=Cryptolaemus montrouzieri TaxID=559131 RepID=A0ABD2P4X7_9CUCU